MDNLTAIRNLTEKKEPQKRLSPKEWWASLTDQEKIDYKEKKESKENLKEIKAADFEERFNDLL
jgi:hypothetical protein